MSQRHRNGFTLIEVLIVIVIMAVLAATIIPQFSDSTEDAREATLGFNLHSLRSQIELYKMQHFGALPAVANDADGIPSLPQLFSRTDDSGAIGADPTTFPFGPYMHEIPTCPVNGNKKFVTGTVVWPPAAETADGGWFYNTNTGQIAPNATDHLTD